jgi:hypothetical protein
MKVAEKGHHIPNHIYQPANKCCFHLTSDLVGGDAAALGLLVPPWKKIKKSAPRRASEAIKR